MPAHRSPSRNWPPDAASDVWSRRLAMPGWKLLPLRAFLGVTFCFASLEKLANPDYLDPHKPTSVAHQMLLLRHSSPLGPLLGLSLHAPTLVALVIAVAELAVGVGTLLGLFPRLAALGGALLALNFFLTVSWSTRPYYYGADIVFVFAWIVMLAFGTGGVLSLDTWLKEQVRRRAGLAPSPAAVSVAVPSVRALCARGAKCGLDADGRCTRLAGCPVFSRDKPLAPALSAELDRRTVVASGIAAAAVGTIALLVGGVTAFVGRAAAGTSRAARRAASTKAPAPSASASPGPQPANSLGSAAALPVGQALAFTNPTDGNPAYVVHTAASTYVAFSAICTHAGCQVQYDPSTVEFACPCHGGVYDARNGQVLQGPPPAPLSSIPVQVVDGQIRVG